MTAGVRAIDHRSSGEAGLARWQGAVLLAVIAAVLGAARATLHPEYTSDLDQLWHAGRALLDGRDPYGVVGPGRELDWPWPVFYPLPAILLILPFCALPVALARAAFGISLAAALGAAMAPTWRRHWPLLASASFLMAIMRSQWSPLVLGALWLPSLGIVLAVKPNMGPVALAPQDRRGILRATSGAAALALVAFLVQPTWVRSWLAAIHDAPSKEVPVLQATGFLLAPVLLLLRTRPGRVIGAMSLVPQTPSLYDLLPVFYIARSARQSLVLATLTHLLHWWVIATGPYGDYEAAYHALGQATVPIVLLPAVLVAWWNHRHPDLGPGDAAMAWPDRVLLGLCLVSLGLQLWLTLLT